MSYTIPYFSQKMFAIFGMAYVMGQLVFYRPLYVQEPIQIKFRLREGPGWVKPPA